MFSPLSSSIEYVKGGKLRALAVTTAARSEVLPDLPTVGEFVPGYQASGWFGVCAPRTTPAEIVDRLNQEINAGLADSKLKARFADLGAMCLSVRRPTSESISPRKPRSGARWSGRPTSGPTEGRGVDQCPVPEGTTRPQSVII
jgi:Tripartite tricarboxylate transporter family receptor